MVSEDALRRPTTYGIIRSVKRQLAALLVAASAVTLAGCTGSTRRDADERAWFRSFTTRVAATLGAPFGLTPVADAYVGSCTDHRAPVSWQATVTALHDGKYPSGVDGVYQVSHTLQGRLLETSGLSGDKVSFVTASKADQHATDTLVLMPTKTSRVQVSVPGATSVLAVGYVSC